jgi:hypothetical protein
MRNFFIYKSPFQDHIVLVSKGPILMRRSGGVAPGAMFFAGNQVQFVRFQGVLGANHW